ncbi:MAG: hypothetical protein GY856_29595, partial [bacterium]|nr:hypothetical protein [bacterium]
MEDAQVLHDILPDVSVWRLCGFVVDYLTVMDVLSRALQQRGLDTVLTQEAVRQCIGRLRSLAARVPDTVAARPGKEHALLSRPDKRSYHGIEVAGRDDGQDILAERADIVGRTLAGLELRFSGEPDGSRAPFRDPTLPDGFHQLADERRWQQSTPATRRELAMHILPFTGVSPEELEGQWGDALQLRAAYSGLAHRQFWTTTLDQMPDRLFRVLSTVHNIRGTSVEAERVFADMTFETRGRKSASGSQRAGPIIFIRHHAAGHPDIAKLADDALVLLKRKMLLKPGRGNSKWRPRINWWRRIRPSQRRDALDEAEANMSDTYRSDQSEGEEEEEEDKDPDLVDAAELLLGKAVGRAFNSGEDILGTDQPAAAPAVEDEDS